MSPGNTTLKISLDFFLGKFASDVTVDMILESLSTEETTVNVLIQRNMDTPRFSSAHFKIF